MRSPFKFQQYGQSGIWVSELMPHFAKQVDNVAMIRSMNTIHPEHEPALFMVHSGRTMQGRPAIGSWAIYGLGTENQSLPAYVVLDDPFGLPINGVQSWQSGFLPAGLPGDAAADEWFSDSESEAGSGEAVGGGPADSRPARAVWTRFTSATHPGQPDLDARIASYELAARMQVQASDALDIPKETDATREMYGIGDEATDSYGKRCLMARRLVERGVRYIQIYINGQLWDHHTESGERDACLLPAHRQTGRRVIGRPETARDC